MTIAVAEEHLELQRSLRGWTARHVLEARRRGATVPAVRPPLAADGFLSLHVAEDHGGGGFGLVELAVVVEELGRALAPGDVVPTLLLSTVLAHAAPEALAKELLPALCSGDAAGAVALDDGLAVAGGRLTGTTAPVLGAPDADHLLVGADGTWVVVDREEVTVEPVEGLDLDRSIGRVSVDLDVGADRTLPGIDVATVRELALVVLAAEAAGIAEWCLETAVEHARTREQFGRAIGQFQAVKHRCAEMLVTTELARAAAWDLARAAPDDDERPLAAAVAGVLAVDGAVRCALDAIQILGGIGYTWEHDAHRYLRRATATRQLVGGPAQWRPAAARLALAGRRRRLHLELDPAAAGPIRAEVRAAIAELPDDDDGRQRALAAGGWLVPHWPRPWGRDAGAVEQLVIDEEFRRAGVDRPDLVIGAWVLPTIIAHGTPDQQQRFVPPTLTGELTWCQLFSEPGAGSDLAALTTRATRTDGGWLLTGQKVWTSLAHHADWGLCLARTDPDAPKHAGITAFLVDMRSAGLDIRPLREITGRDSFNEVFLDDVFVPDDGVLGPVDGGWKVGRTTLANERVAMVDGSSMGSGVEGVLAAVAASFEPDDPVLLDRLGALVCAGQALSLLAFRTTLRRLAGVEPGAEASVRKLIGGRHAQACAELTLEVLGPVGATIEGPAARATHAFLQSQCLTIAGGTSDVQRNVIAERLLGLPRDPEPGA